jgi:hypothetical protein
MELQLNWTTCFAVAGYVAANPAVRQALLWTGRAAMTVNWKRFTVPASVALVALALFWEVPVSAQMRRGTRVAGTKATGADPNLGAVVATFGGTLKSITKKDMAIEIENGNSVEFKVIGKTTYFVGDKQVKAKDIAVETPVTIEGKKDGFGVLTAMKVSVKSVPPGGAEPDPRD